MITRHRRPVIAHVLHRLHLAGAEVLAADLARRIGHPADQTAPYTFIFLCLDEIGELGEQLIREGFQVTHLSRRPGVDLAIGNKIARQVRELDVDLFHAHQYTPFFYASLSRGVRSTPPILFTEHGRHYPDHRRPKRVIANKFLMRRGDRVTAVAHWIKQALVDNEGIPADRIEVIHNGIDPGKFNVDTTGEVRRAVRLELDIAPDQPTILQVARFHPVKDHATALQAFALVLSQVPGAVLLLAGDGDERQRLHTLCVELGIRDRVRFLGVRRDVPRLMAAADAFLLSSLSEGISVTLLEAMGCGLPIVATNVGGNPEVVVDGQTGLLSPRSDSAGLARNLIALLRDPARRKAFAAAGRQRLLDHFVQDANHQRYRELYDAMLSRDA